MDPNQWLERQERELQEQFDAGKIDRSKFDLEMRDIHREYREMAREAAQNAYDDELDRW